MLNVSNLLNPHSHARHLHSALCYLPWVSPHHHFQVEAILHLLPSILVPPALPAPSPRFAQSAEQNGERAGERCLVSSFIIHPSTFIICPRSGLIKPKQ